MQREGHKDLLNRAGGGGGTVLVDCFHSFICWSTSLKDRIAVPIRSRRALKMTCNLTDQHDLWVSMEGNSSHATGAAAIDLLQVSDFA